MRSPLGCASLRALRACVVLTLLAGAGCESVGAPGGGRDPRNLFANPGFENGPAPWYSLDAEYWGRPFRVSDRRAHGGSRSALLELRSEGPEDRTRICGVVVEVSPESLPEILSAHYRVDRWEQGTPIQYLQIVVIAWGASNVPLQRVTNHQIRYVLGGFPQQPTRIYNARYVMVSRDPPPRGRWLRFERNLHEDFRALWGSVPVGFSKLRLLFEVRWDGRRPGEDASLADVYFDDLYLGPPRL